MFRIGTVNIDTSHAPSFAEILQKGDVARYTCVYNDGFRTDEEVDAFITRFGLEKRYTSLEEMAGNVDIAFIQGCDWDRHLALAEPFVKAGVPVFIDKPIVGNLRDCHTLEAWAASGAVILGTSALRYTYEHDDFFSVPAADRGDIVHVTTSVGVDEFNYAIHAVESIMGFMQRRQACRRPLHRALARGRNAGRFVLCDLRQRRVGLLSHLPEGLAAFHRDGRHDENDVCVQDRHQ